MIEKIIKECEDEEIQFSNCIHNFGYLIAIEKESHRIKFVSENITDLTNYSAEVQFILDEMFASVFEFEINFELVSQQEEGMISKEYVQFGGKNYFCVVYHYLDYYYLEFEEDKKNKIASSFYQNSEQLLYTKDKNENWEFLIKRIKELTGYQRVLIYKLLEDKSGHVIYEEVDEGVDSYLGLHFPEFDIPSQARELYVKKRNRIVPDVDAKPVKIIGVDDKRIDLTFSEFRSISPVHLQYLSNFNLKSSFSVSIVINNKLWGMVSCHNQTAKHIPINIRKQCEILVRLARINYVNFKFDEQLKYQEKFQKVMVKLKEELLIQDNYNISSFVPLLKFTKADGVAYLIKDEVQTYLKTPSYHEILAIRDWAKAHQLKQLYYSHSFFNDYKNELKISSLSAGVAFRFLDSDYENFIIWFKEESHLELNWAGKPEKVVETIVTDQQEIHTFSPRKNFEVWKSIKNGQSEIWKEKEINVIKEIINLILETIHVKAFKISELYEQLKEINAELDSFSYTVSHDLRTPLTVMRLNCQLLERAVKDDASNAQKVKDIIGQIDNLSEMMEEILKLSKSKKSDIELVTINAEVLIHKIVEEAKIYNNCEQTKVDILHPIDFRCDKTMAYEIFLNLINNALKYSSQTAQPKVEISASEDDEFIIYQVVDNGIGIKAEDRPKMFKLFSRMSNTSSFKGNGVGLSIVHRMMERLDGSIDFISEENKGTTFILKFKK